MAWYNSLPFWNSAKGADAPPLMSDERAQMVQNVAPWWYGLAKQGKVFTASAAVAGIVLPAYNATAQLFGLWNPSGSGVNAILCNVQMAYVDTTGAATGFAFSTNKNIGSALATGGISAFTEATPDKAIGPGVGGNSVRVTTSAATTIAPTMWRPLGMNQLVITATDATTAAFTSYREFAGDWIVGQGQAVWLVGNIAQLTKWVPSITWAELPA